MSPRPKENRPEPTTITQEEAREMAVKIIMNQRDQGNSISLTMVGSILGGVLGAKNQEIRGCEHSHELFSPYNVTEIVRMINSDRQVFAIGITKDGLGYDQLGIDPGDDTKIEWLPRRGSPVKAILTFTDADAEYFILDDHKRDMELKRLNGSVSAQVDRDKIRQTTLPSASHVLDLASNDDPAISKGA